MRARLILEIDGLPEGSDEKFADEFQELLNEVAKGMPAGLVMRLAVEVGVVRRQAEIVTRTARRALPAPKKGRPAPRRSLAARAPPAPPSKVGLASGLLNRPRPRRWSGPSTK